MAFARLFAGLCLGTSLLVTAPSHAADPFAAFGIQGDPFAHPGHEADLTFVWMASGPSLQSIDITVYLPGGVLPLGYAKALPDGYVGGCCPNYFGDGWVCNWRLDDQTVSVEAVRDEISLRVLYEPYRFVPGDTAWVEGDVEARFEVQGQPVNYDGYGELELMMGSPNDDDGGLSINTEWSFDTAGYASIDFWPWQSQNQFAAAAINRAIQQEGEWTGYYVPMRIDLIAEDGFALASSWKNERYSELTVDLPCDVVLYDYEGFYDADFYLDWCTNPYEGSDGCLQQTCYFEFNADFGRLDEWTVGDTTGVDCADTLCMQWQGEQYPPPGCQFVEYDDDNSTSLNLYLAAGCDQLSETLLNGREAHVDALYWDAGGCNDAVNGRLGCEPQSYEIQTWDTLDANQTPWWWGDYYDPCWEKAQDEVDVQLNEQFTWPGGYYTLVGRFDPIADPVNYDAFFSMSLPPRNSTSSLEGRLTDLDAFHAPFYQYPWAAPDEFEGWACFMPELEGMVLEEGDFVLDDCAELATLSYEEMNDATHLVFLNEQWGGQFSEIQNDQPYARYVERDVWGPQFSIATLQTPCMEDLPDVAQPDEVDDWTYYLYSSAYGSAYPPYEEGRSQDWDNGTVIIDAHSIGVIADPREELHVVAPGEQVTLLVDPLTWGGAPMVDPYFIIPFPEGLELGDVELLSPTCDASNWHMAYDLDEQGMLWVWPAPADGGDVFLSTYCYDGCRTGDFVLALTIVVPPEYVFPSETLTTDVDFKLEADNQLDNEYYWPYRKAVRHLTCVGSQANHDEVCNGRDDNCNGVADEGCDDDGDGWCDVAMGGDDNSEDGVYPACEPGDCDDANYDRHPGATEKCGDTDDFGMPLDNNCNGCTDEGCDVDQDGYCHQPFEGGFGVNAAFIDNGGGDIGVIGQCQGTPIYGYCPPEDDCNDLVETIHPYAGEYCDGVDSDCAGDSDDGLTGDPCGLGICATFEVCVVDPSSEQGAYFECPYIAPESAETCNDGEDDDCNGCVDDGCDDDKDGHCDADIALCDPTGGNGTPTLVRAALTVGGGDGGPLCQSSGPCSCDGDCDDDNATINPNAYEDCNGVDDNCDGTDDQGLMGSYCNFGSCWGQQVCNPDGWHCTAEDQVGEEVCDYVDNNCNYQIDEGFDVGSGCELDNPYCRGEVECSIGHVSNERAIATVSIGGQTTVCSTFPGGSRYVERAEIACDGIDDNCNGETDEGCDDDDDGGCDAAMACNHQSTVCSHCGDCNDEDGAVNADALELCDDVDNDCDSDTDDGCDLDGDEHCETGSCGPNGTPEACAQGCDDCDDLDGEAYPGATELCSARDEDCDGHPNNGYADLGHVCRDDAAQCPASGHYVCTLEGAMVCDAKGGDGSPEICDGADNDCDGHVDEDCDVDGDHYCTTAVACLVTPSGAPLAACDKGCGDCNDAPPGGTPVNPGAAELCDGFDNDCDGVVDEGCDADGDGWCGAGCTGVSAKCPNGCGDCHDDAQAIHPGATELCNGFDDNCNGTSDEGFPLLDQQCTDGSGACAATGVYVCNAARNGVECNAHGGDGTPERCDGIDNDCKNGVDDGCDDDHDQYCDAHMACLVGAELAACPGGCGDCADDNATVKPGAAEVCNGVDNDCNGVVDDHCDDDLDGHCGTGHVCAAGALCQGGCDDCDDSAPAKYPGAHEACNGIDDNCDGTNDEGYSLGGTCTVGGGGCSATGTYVCNANGDGVTCGAEVGDGSAEICDGIDNDCNGVVDDGCDDDGDDWCDGAMVCDPNATRPVCPKGCGDCDDALANGAARHPQALELCDNLDNDCNARVDDGCDDDDDGQCKIGRCVQGVTPTTCLGGCTDCKDDSPFIHVGATEKCNGIDDNCDLVADNGFVLGAPCTVGSAECTAHGVTICNDAGNATTCGAVAGDGSDERCDGVDNDCNGQVDEGCDADDDGWCGGDMACLVGVSIAACEHGCNDCNDGARGENPGATEVCNGKDDDCDGDTDEGCDDDHDLHCDAAMACSGGAACACDDDCDDERAATYEGAPERCNGIDDDCDEIADNGFTLGGSCELSAGACHAVGTWVCKEDGSGAECDARPGDDSAERCDGIDNDCNGTVDDGCDSDGDHYCDDAMGCLGGVALTACSAGCGDCADDNATVNPGVGEICDGVDNDCDGVVDNGCDDDHDGHCDVALGCTMPLPPGCAAGCDDCNDAVATTYGGAAERCNGVDDDCDEIADNGLGVGQPCTVGDGACVGHGETVCNANGQGTHCGAIAGDGTAEVCDDVDNDCNGDTDEGCDDDGDGWCDDALGCVSGRPIPACEHGCGDCDDDNETGADINPQAVDLCDGEDNDCDGVPDGACDEDGDGECDAAIACTGEGVAERCPNGCDDCDDDDAAVGSSAAEACNGQDDDCDGVADNGFALGGSCSVGQGACQSHGTFVCSPTGEVACSAVAGPKEDERCDGVDNDCDGQVDNGFGVGASCFGGQGECRVPGVTVCDPDGEGVVCAAEPDDNAPELCDGRDNDCDGFTDDGLGLGEPCTVGRGECTSEVGERVCAADGSVTCSARAGAPHAETCDGKDNDCDGDTDEPGGGGGCAALDTVIDAGPETLTASAKATFAYHNPLTPGHSTYQCAFDGATWVACPGGAITFEGVADGSHTLLVRATRPDGEVDDTPAYWAWVVDARVPDTIIALKPDDPSQSSEASFVFEATIDDIGEFRCALDPAVVPPPASAFKTCEATHELRGLAEGRHQIWVYVVSEAGVADPIPASYAWTIDTSAPATVITEAPPAATRSRAASFAYENPADPSQEDFECRLDDGAWTACDGGHEDYSGLADGSHVFEVRSVGPSGIVDPTPARALWTIDGHAPETVIAVHPQDPAQRGDGLFGFESDEVATFHCMIDPPAGTATASYPTCPATFAFEGLADGTHTMVVYAVDTAGNVDATPARFTWVIDSSYPDTVITDAPPRLAGSDEDAEIAFEDPADTADGFECRVDGGAWAACESPTTIADPALGEHLFEVRSCRDVEAVNGAVEHRCDPTPAVHAWAVDGSPCPLDATVPLLSCVPEVRIECVAGGADIDASSYRPTASDACGIATTDEEAPERFDLGDTVVVYAATDGNGNVGTCATSFRVEDTVAPTIHCPVDVEVDADPVTCGVAVPLAAPVSDDACTSDLTVYHDAPVAFGVGETVVTWHALDQSGHESTCEQRVTVVDRSALVIACEAAIERDAPADVCAWSGTLTAEGEDNCNLDALEVTVTDRWAVGAQDVVFSATDASGNAGTCTSALTVRDVTPPVPACGPALLVAPGEIHPSAEDACRADVSIASVTCDGAACDAGLAVIDGPRLAIMAWPARAAAIAYRVVATDPSGNSAELDCAFTLAGDADRDGVIDEDDNCVDVPNTDQSDPDDDGVGSACDVCPTVDDPAQLDSDGDGTGDLCQDLDVDEVIDIEDSCIVDPNTDQLDSDGDGIGDACDPFDDGLAASGGAGGCSGGESAPWVGLALVAWALARRRSSAR